MASTTQQQTASAAAASGATGGPHTAAYTAPDPRAEARRLLVEASEMTAMALDAVAKEGDPRRAGELAGRSSDRIGQALHFLRQLLRR